MMESCGVEVLKPFSHPGWPSYRPKKLKLPVLSPYFVETGLTVPTADKIKSLLLSNFVWQA